MAKSSSDVEKSVTGDHMETMQELLPHFKTGLVDLQEMKDQGKKIIGYIPNGYMPEELVLACRAVPVALARGGDTAPVQASAACLARFLDPFCRAQIGYRLLKEEPAYQLLDMLIVPMTDNHVRGIADSWDFYTDVEVFRFGVPHVKARHGFEYYLDGLYLLRKHLEKFTGNQITPSGLTEEMDVANQIRKFLREISLMRRADSPPISGKEFIELNHSSFYTDRNAYLDVLRSFSKKLKSAKPVSPIRPRVLLAGSTMALGDSRIVDLLEEAGASIVIEEFSEGLRRYWQDAGSGDDPMQALAECYFAKRLPDAFFRGAAKERIDFFLGLIQRFKADAVVWYTLAYRDSFEVEGYIFHKTLENLGVPMLRLSSDYEIAETGGLRTRIETFVSTIQRR
jgi:benzoyl-CoA reductase/2-hydroxyglutaryl-CoA dehydratase subunit BcrC/BadD/HgdB